MPEGVTMKRRIFSTMAATGLGFAVAVAAASPAKAEPSGTATLTGGTVDAKGAGVSLSFDYTCAWDPNTEFQNVSVQATVTQKVGGNAVAQATNLGTNQLVCDGTQRSATISGSANPGPAFKSGIALAQGWLSVCEVFECVDIPLRGEVKLSKK
jgi:hypothetical protein